MGAPVETGIENFEEVILGLSKADRVKLLGWIAESLVEEENPPSVLEIEPTQEDADLTTEDEIEWPHKNLRIGNNPSGKKSWYEDIPSPKDLTEEEWKAKVHEVAGSWNDHPMSAEELIEDIYSSRTISTREINLDG